MKSLEILCQAALFTYNILFAFEDSPVEGTHPESDLPVTGTPLSLIHR